MELGLVWEEETPECLTGNGKNLDSNWVRWSEKYSSDHSLGIVHAFRHKIFEFSSDFIASRETQEKYEKYKKKTFEWHLRSEQS